MLYISASGKFYRFWCGDKGHSSSKPSIPMLIDLFIILRRKKGLFVLAIKSKRSLLSTVFRAVLPEVSSSSWLHDIIRSFETESVAEPVCPIWDLKVVFRTLSSNQVRGYG